MQKNSVDYATDEIDLLDIIEQLWQGKWIILSSALLCLLIAGGYLMLATPKWNAEVTLAKPYLNQLANYPRGVILSQMLLSPTDDTSNNGSRSVSNGGDEGKIIDEAFNTFIAVANENPNQQPITLKPGAVHGTFLLSYSDSSARSAEKNLQSILSSLNTLSQQRLYAALQSTLQERAHTLQLQMQAQENNARAHRKYRLSMLQNALQIAMKMDIQQSKISQPSGEISDDLLFMLGVPTLRAIIEHENNLPLNLSNSYYDAKAILASINSFKANHDNFNAVSVSPCETIRSGPKRGLILVLSVLLGLIASSGYILLRNALQNNINRK